MVETRVHLQNIWDCRDVCQAIQDKYLVDFRNTSIKLSPIKRIYCWVCYKAGYSLWEIAKGMGISHTTIIHHLRKCSEDEKKHAEEIINSLPVQNKPSNPLEIPLKKNIYEITGFRYDRGKKECSDRWRRFYPLKPPYRGI